VHPRLVAKDQRRADRGDLDWGGRSERASGHSISWVAFLGSTLGELDGNGHRVVHGGPDLASP
jgi:hypothetical protein